MPGDSVAKTIYHLDVHSSSESGDPHWTNYLTLSRNSEGQPLLRPSYRKFLCSECHTLNKDALFDQGFIGKAGRRLNAPLMASCVFTPASSNCSSSIRLGALTANPFRSQPGTSYG